MFCPKCGESNADDAPKCASCGHGLRLKASPVQASGGVADDAAMRMILPVGRSGLAIVAGYLGLLSVTLVLAPLAVVFGVLAVRDLKANPEKRGMGRAIFGIAMGAIFSVVLLIALVGGP